MSEAKIESLGDGRVRVDGDLDFDTVPRLLGSAVGVFAQSGSRVTVDLSGVRQTKSVGLALLVEWLRVAHRTEKKITFVNVPPQLLAMARASGLETILELEHA